MNDLDQQLRDYYQSQELSESRLDQILASTKIVRPVWWKRPASLVSLAAAVVFLLALPVLLFRASPALESQIAMQVAKNHLKQLAPEIASPDWSQIQAALPRLAFAVAPTRPELLAGFQVLGGRYCSILDELAAQISLLDPQGKPCTLYIAPLSADLQEARPGIYHHGEVTVQVWRDAHRIFALARE